MKKAIAYSKVVTIPTYGVGEAEKNPIFIEKRVYQGSSGKVYPNPIIEKICDEKVDKRYDTVVLENDFICVTVIPSLGGRIYSAMDKSNGYDFIYRNEVIKPALVGLLGPWISGGIEFNWPQHHRPSTYMSASYKICNNEDGSASVFVGEIENMFGTKGVAEIKLYADKAYIEINVRLYNRTDVPQTFLWWANPAVAANDHTKTIMPPDVTAVMDHGKRAVSSFPIATGEYYKMDYSSGVDISMYKNIPVPTSFMAYKSNFDFVGEYDFSLDEGLYHYADHHVSPGKKQWTWGCGEFGKAWDRNLTDVNGPYIELMTGCFTDNQPDFTFIAPHEEKGFTQYFMPYKNVGEIKNANKDFCLNVTNGELIIYSTGVHYNVKIKVSENCTTIFEDNLDFSPSTKYIKKINCGDSAEVCIDYDGGQLTYAPSKIEKFDIPSAATACPPPEQCETLEELYLYGLHIEQYRHATRKAEDYYLEGLGRDSTDVRLNNAYGLLLLRRGDFVASIEYFEKAILKLTCKNPNPYDTEPYYNLGLAYLYCGKLDLSYDNFYKSIWGNYNKSAAFYFMAVISARKNDYKRAMEHLENSVIYNGRNMKAYSLKGSILLALGEKEKAMAVFAQTQNIDHLDVIADFEIALNNGTPSNLLQQSRETEIVDLAYEYILCGNYERAISLIVNYNNCSGSDYPLLWYYKAYAEMQMNVDSTASLQKAINNADKLCFAHRLSDIIVLQKIVEVTPDDYLANYYLGNIFYDKKQYDKAAEYWHSAMKANCDFPTVKRNLALYYYNKRKNSVLALSLLEQSFEIDATDSRILMELDQLYKVLNKPDEFRLKFLRDNLATVELRDDVYLEYLTLLNSAGKSEKTEQLLNNRIFHSWEGGEGKSSKLYKQNKIDLAINAIKIKKYEIAFAKLTEALERPYNLGEGKLLLDGDNDVYYYLGELSEQMGNNADAKQYYTMATSGNISIADDLYYNDNPIEYVYYMALAYKKLNNMEQANKIKTALMNCYSVNIDKVTSIDYFAVSLPDMQIWEQNLDEKNKCFCLKIKAMAERL